jgi:FkbM family methyltransferase
MILLPLIRLYISIVYVLRHTYGFHMRGVGKVLNFVRKPYVLNVEGIKVYADPALATSYYFMFIGKFNEPETHILINNLLHRVKDKLLILDVGMNIGEMVLDFARHPSVSQIHGFEPNELCIHSVQRSIKLNLFRNIQVHNIALGRTKGIVLFHLGSSAVTSSSIFMKDGEVTNVPMSTIDDECPNLSSESIIIIDVEGAELNVVAGGCAFIQRNKPLIVFEYHQVTRTVFPLKDMSQELGEDYQLYRLRGDGMIDQNLEETWNCVAVHRNSIWHSHILSFLVHDVK